MRNEVESRASLFLLTDSHSSVSWVLVVCLVTNQVMLAERLELRVLLVGLVESQASTVVAVEPMGKLERLVRPAQKEPLQAVAEQEREVA